LRISHFILAAFVLANFMVAPVIYNPRFVSWQPGVFETGILNLQDDAVGGHGEKMLSIPPTEGIFSKSKSYSEVKIFFDPIIFGGLNLGFPSLRFHIITGKLFCVSFLHTHLSQPELCTFLI